ncbi:MAG: rRNA maturation RNase YbeY [Aquificae bacterium]|nr:rRNA maturation RNase YbeY [Aquificota bacterium]
MNNIFINKDYRTTKIKKEQLHQILAQMLEYLGIDNVEVGLTLTDNTNIRQLNKEWRDKDKPTDVLSFPAGEIPGYRYKVLGDIVISVPYTKKQAENLGVSFYEELVRLIAHGLLHLLGYDHEKSQKEARLMFDKQEKLIKHILDKNITGK